MSTQISLCFIHILKIINHISLIDEDISFNTQDLKKYSVKFSHITIYGAKINLEFIKEKIRSETEYYITILNKMNKISVSTLTNYFF